ncbi:MAG: hypothetical protein HWE22_14905 [Flavobacteriales bacterium]|nr:hypothetical protein [Flavobacteriales bacterium]
MTNHIGKFLFGIILICFGGCSAGDESTPEKKNERNIASIIQSNNWHSLHLDIHEIPCFGRNVLEVDLSYNNPEITAEIVYRRNHSIMLNNASDSLIDAARKEIGIEYDEIFFDTIIQLNKQDFINSIVKAYENKNSTEMTPAGYALEVQLIDGRDTLSCTAKNSDFINIFNKYDN